MGMGPTKSFRLPPLPPPPNLYLSQVVVTIEGLQPQVMELRVGRLVLNSHTEEKDVGLVKEKCF